jgi:hypothetical protein
VSLRSNSALAFSERNILSGGVQQAVVGEGESGRQEYPKKIHGAAVLENSHSFSEGENIPKKYTSDGVTVSAALREANGKVARMIFAGHENSGRIAGEIKRQQQFRIGQQRT